MDIKNSFRFLSCSLILLVAGTGILHAQSQIVKKELPGYGEVEFYENEVIVKYKEGLESERAELVRGQFSAKSIATLQTRPIELLKMRDRTTEESLRLLSDHPDVEFAEPNFVYRLIQPTEKKEIYPVSLLDNGDQEGIKPDDTFFNRLWGLLNEGQFIPELGISGTPGADISAHLAWELTTGSEEVIIAILDTGIDYNHPDLIDNMFQDEEGNFGINTSPGRSEEEAFDPMDDNGHGTHVAGTIGAVGNNGIGVAGINWDVKLMAVKIFDDEGNTSAMSIINGLEYALEQGAMISNHSYGGYGFSQSQFDKFEEARDAGHLVIASAGNDGTDNDSRPLYPASFELENVISVGASDLHDNLTRFSNFGATSVDIIAPGLGIASTYSNPNNEAQYAFFSGTSMSGPHVTGVAGLVKALYPDVTYVDIRNRILNHADRLENLEGIIQENRRLNAFTSLLDDDGIAPATITDLSASDYGQQFIQLAWTAVGYSGNEGFAQNYDFRISDSPITESNFDDANPLNLTIVPKYAGEQQQARIKNLTPGTTYFIAVKAEDFFGNRSDVSNLLELTTRDSPVIQVSGGPVVVNHEVDEVRDYKVTVTNSGEGDLELFATGRFRPVSLADLGFRRFPYMYTSTLNESSPTYDWKNIQGLDAPVNFSDGRNGMEEVDLPFEFPFFGKVRDKLFVSVNGFVSFNDVFNLEESASNQNIPSPARPNGLIAVHWMDHDLGNIGRVYTYHDEDNDRFIIQWNNLSKGPADFYSDLSYTYQLILYRGGAITMQYRNLESATREISVGIEDDDGTHGFNFAFNQQRIEEEMAITYLPGQPDWLEISETELVLGSGESTDIEFQINTSGLAPGTYFTDLFFLNNDLSSGTTRIPVKVEVEGEIANVQFIHVSRDPALSVFDLFINGRMLEQKVNFNSTSRLIPVPANREIELSLITVNSESEQDPIARRTVQFKPDKEYYAIAAGIQETAIAGAESSYSSGFNFYTRERVSADVDDDDVRMIFFNGVEDLPSVGLIGFFDEQRPPFVLVQNLGYGEFSSYKTFKAQDYEADLVESENLIDTFNFRTDVLSGNTILVAVTGKANSTNGESDIRMIYSRDENISDQFQKSQAGRTTPRHIPEAVKLEQNFPNPFNPATVIQFQLPEEREVKLVIYDLLGRAVQTLVDERLTAGIHRYTFDGTGLASGLYIYRFKAGNDQVTRKMMLVK